jgi:hypothetical protein
MVAVHTGFWCGNLREDDHLEDEGVDGRIILKRVLEKWAELMDWSDLAQDRDRWRDVVTAVMNIRVSINCRAFLD